MSDDDVEIDFEPQNGYGEMPGLTPYEQQGTGSPGGRKQKMKAMKEPR